MVRLAILLAANFCETNARSKALGRTASKVDYSFLLLERQGEACDKLADELEKAGCVSLLPSHSRSLSVFELSLSLSLTSNLSLSVRVSFQRPRLQGAPSQGGGGRDRVQRTAEEGGRSSPLYNRAQASRGIQVGKLRDRDGEMAPSRTALSYLLQSGVEGEPLFLLCYLSLSLSLSLSHTHPVPPTNLSTLSLSLSYRSRAMATTRERSGGRGWKSCYTGDVDSSHLSLCIYLSLCVSPVSIYQSIHLSCIPRGDLSCCIKRKDVRMLVETFHAKLPFFIHVARGDEFPFFFSSHTPFYRLCFPLCTASLNLI